MVRRMATARTEPWFSTAMTKVASSSACEKPACQVPRLTPPRAVLQQTPAHTWRGKAGPQRLCLRLQLGHRPSKHQAPGAGAAGAQQAAVQQAHRPAIWRVRVTHCAASGVLQALTLAFCQQGACRFESQHMCVTHRCGLVPVSTHLPGEQSHSRCARWQLRWQHAHVGCST